MYRLIYLSTAKEFFKTKELESLLAKSKVNNSKLDITGLLITKGKSFLQCLEGQKNNVLKVYSLIQKDPRHKIILFIEDDYEDRLFPQWSMGYTNLENISDIKSNKIKELVLKDLEHLKDSEIYELFRYFVK